MRILPPAAALLALLAGTAFGQAGRTGADFLQIGAGPRGVAMGEAGTAVADDSYAGYWNPAGLSLLRYPEAALMHNQMYQGITQQFLSYSHPLGPGHALSANLTSLQVGDIESYDATGVRRGNVDAGDLAVSAAYGRLLGTRSAGLPEVRLGVGGKYISQRLAGVSAATFAGDFGAMVGRFDNVFGDAARGYRLGFAVRNVGPGLKFQTERTPLPRSYSLGLAWEGKPWGDPLIAAFDYKLATDGSGGTPALGLEYWVKRVLALRAGYSIGQDTGLGLRFGLGVRLKRVTVEYAMAGFGDLGDMHRFGLTYRFGGAADVQERGVGDFIKRGQSYYEQRRYFEAVTEFNRALEIDPGNRKALELMRKSLSAMDKPAEEQKPAPAPAPAPAPVPAPGHLPDLAPEAMPAPQAAPEPAPAAPQPEAQAPQAAPLPQNSPATAEERGR